jgi:biopolymer transport protein ExbB
MAEIIVSQFYSIGGPILIALIVLSVVATATAIFKLMALARLGVGKRKAAAQALALWAAGDAKGGRQVVASDSAALSQVVAGAMAARMRWPDDKERAREVATSAALTLLDEMNRHVRILETSVQAAPMLGLLGTVLGMIAAFNEMSGGGGAVNPTELAGGIWVALSTTALGLAIAIPFYFFTSWIEGRIERERAAMDNAILTVIYGQGAELAQSPPAASHTQEVGSEPVPLRR